MARCVYYVAMSADGFIAAPDGGVAWLDAYNASELGYDAFVATVGAVVLGRRTYEQMLGFGPWPYGDRPGLVVTSRPVSELPPTVRSVGPAELGAAVGALRRATPRDVWVVGGGKTARACLEAGLVDEVELYVIPYLLGAGVPLLSPGSALRGLRLVETRRFDNGIVRLLYATGSQTVRQT